MQKRQYLLPIRKIKPSVNSLRGRIYSPKNANGEDAAWSGKSERRSCKGTAGVLLRLVYSIRPFCTYIVWLILEDLKTPHFKQFIEKQSELLLQTSFEKLMELVADDPIASFDTIKEKLKSPALQ
jgi:hypothetical protein